jgi:hypothetical protein
VPCGRFFCAAVSPFSTISYRGLPSRLPVEEDRVHHDGIQDDGEDYAQAIAASHGAREANSGAVFGVENPSGHFSISDRKNFKSSTAPRLYRSVIPFLAWPLIFFNAPGCWMSIEKCYFVEELMEARVGIEPAPLVDPSQVTDSTFREKRQNRWKRKRRLRGGYAEYRWVF